MVRAGEGGNQRHIGCFCCFECHAALAIGWRMPPAERISAHAATALRPRNFAWGFQTVLNVDVGTGVGGDMNPFGSGQFHRTDGAYPG
jgi:hypothetical protein